MSNKQGVIGICGVTMDSCPNNVVLMSYAGFSMVARDNVPLLQGSSIMPKLPIKTES